MYTKDLYVQLILIILINNNKLKERNVDLCVELHLSRENIIIAIWNIINVMNFITKLKLYNTAIVFSECGDLFRFIFAFDNFLLRIII